MDRLLVYMRKQHVPEHLQRSIYNYYEFSYKRNWTFNRGDLFPNIPSILDLQLQLALKQRLIKQCTMFADCQPQTVMTLVQRLQSTIAIPNQVIFTVILIHLLVGCIQQSFDAKMIEFLRIIKSSKIVINNALPSTTPRRCQGRIYRPVLDIS